LHIKTNIFPSPIAIQLFTTIK